MTAISIMVIVRCACNYTVYLSDRVYRLLKKIQASSGQGKKWRQIRLERIWTTNVAHLSEIQGGISSKSAVYMRVNEHFEPITNAVIYRMRVFQQLSRVLQI